MGGGFKHYQNSAGLGRGKEGDIGKKIKRQQRQKVRRYSPKRHEEVPGGRDFLTSIFCFRKAAN